MLVTTSTFQQLIMQAKATYLAGLPFAYIGLFINVITITRATTQSMLVEASFPGYSRITSSLNFGAPYLNGSGFYQIDRVGLAQFTPSVITAGQNVYGYFVGTGPNGLLWAENNPAGPTLVGATLLPYIAQISIMESQWNPTNP